jgi:hypothetical protein
MKPSVQTKSSSYQARTGIYGLYVCVSEAMRLIIQFFHCSTPTVLVFHLHSWSLSLFCATDLPNHVIWLNHSIQIKYIHGLLLWFFFARHVIMSWRHSNTPVCRKVHTLLANPCLVLQAHGQILERSIMQVSPGQTVNLCDRTLSDILYFTPFPERTCIIEPFPTFYASILSSLLSWWHLQCHVHNGQPITITHRPQEEQEARSGVKYSPTLFRIWAWFLLWNTAQLYFVPERPPKKNLHPKMIVKWD